jgi:hypothetical protein
MSTSNGVVHRAEQAHLESVRKAKSAAAAGEQSPSAVASPASARAPESYQSQFFAVLQDIVSSAHGERKKPSIAGKRTDVVARLLTLSRRLEDGCKPALYQQAYFAARLWQANPSVGSTVSAVLDDLEFCSSRNSPIYTVMYGLLASLLGLSGGALAILALSSWVYAWASGSPWPAVIRDPYCALLTSPLLVASTFGMLGAAVSVLLRLSEFEHATRRSRHFLRMTGVVLPFVGAVFASVTCAVFQAGIVNVSAAGGSTSASLLDNRSFFIVIGFLSGFSERFTRGLLGTAERSLTTLREEQTTMRTNRATLKRITHRTNVRKHQVPAA